jgi:hypothetical protein
MVWIHGGALVSGESNDYDPTALVADGVTVVTINYRLGALGFLAHPALADARARRVTTATAALIGRVFWSGPVCELVEGADPEFGQLQERAFVLPHAESSIEGSGSGRSSTR